jgi:hypothetical protein
VDNEQHALAQHADFDWWLVGSSKPHWWHKQPKQIWTRAAKSCAKIMQGGTKAAKASRNKQCKQAGKWL